MTQIIAAIVGAVALVVLCEGCYALGRIQGKKEGIEEYTEENERLKLEIQLSNKIISDKTKSIEEIRSYTVREMQGRLKAEAYILKLNGMPKSVDVATIERTADEMLNQEWKDL